MAQDYSLQQKIKKAVRNEKSLNLEMKKKFQIFFKEEEKKQRAEVLRKKELEKKALEEKIRKERERECRKCGK